MKLSKTTAELLAEIKLLQSEKSTLKDAVEKYTDLVTDINNQMREIVKAAGKEDVGLIKELLSALITNISAKVNELLKFAKENQVR